MKTREDILQILAREKRNLAAQFKVQSLALFGSYARNEQRQDSDVDILVDVDPSIGLEFVTLADRIEKLLGLPVELVSLRRHQAPVPESHRAGFDLCLDGRPNFFWMTSGKPSKRSSGTPGISRWMDSWPMRKPRMPS